MDIAAMNEKITIQTNSATTDSVGNHLTIWADSFTCHATISGQSVSEEEIAGQTVIRDSIDFTIRYSSITKNLTAKNNRVIYRGEKYNIEGIDCMNMKKRCLKLKCRRVRR